MIKTHKNEENTKLGESDSENEEEEKMPEPPRNFYKTRAEAEKNRRRGERIYYKKGKGYYRRRPQPREKTIWEKILGW